MKKKALLSMLMLSTLTIGAVQNASAAGTEAVTDGTVSFRAPGPEDNKIVQPGTKDSITMDSSAGEDSTGIYITPGDDSEAADKGYVQLLFAPSFHFGTVVANYTDDSVYLADAIQVNNSKVAGTKFINHFMQVADYSEGISEWNVNVGMETFSNDETGHVLAGTTISLHASNLLSDHNQSLAGLGLLGVLGANASAIIPTDGSTIDALSHNTTAATNGTRVSQVFGAVDTAKANDYQSVDATGNVANITTTKGKNAGVHINVPRADRVQVGRQYQADITWTLSATFTSDEDEA
jgi:hypothetical protein